MIVHIGDMINACKIIVGKSEMKRLIGIHGCGSENDISGELRVLGLDVSTGFV
jgi:hypothetical protein